MRFRLRLAAYLKNELAKKNGEDVTYEAVRLGGLPPETEWILSENGIETPRLIEGVGEGDKVILVDHSEALQSAEGLENAEIVEIVDHHRLGGLTTAQPLRYNAMPVGSTCAIVAREFGIEGIEMPKGYRCRAVGRHAYRHGDHEVSHHHEFRPRYHRKRLNSLALTRWSTA